MLEMFKDLYYGTIDMWKHDRREFWETYLTLALLIFLIWFLFWFVIPTMG